MHKTTHNHSVIQYLFIVPSTTQTLRTKQRVGKNVLIAPKIDTINIMYLEHCIVPALAHTQHLKTFILLITAHKLSTC